MKLRACVCAGVVICLVLALTVTGQAQSSQSGARPPEVGEIQKALRIQDPASRVKELERIKAAYPSTQYMGRLNSAIQFAKIEMAGSVDEVLKLQEPMLNSVRGFDRISLLYSFSWQLLKHTNAAKFDKAKLLEAVLGYCEMGLKTARDPDFQKSLPSEQLPVLNKNWPNFYLVEANAYLVGGNAPKASAAMVDYLKNGGARSGDYAYTQAELDSALGRQKEALAEYLTALGANYGDSLDKAKALYQKMYGSLAGFEARVEALERELPFNPGKAGVPAKWAGKTVLTELFTGSECPPCLGVDLAFDGLLEAYDPKYLVVLEYHLPIPNPDPMMCPGSRKRRTDYGVSGTPTPYFDGVKNDSGGGNRAVAEEKFKEFSSAISSRLAEAPKVRLTVRGVLQGELVNVQFTADKPVTGADIHLVLVQKEIKYRGANGIMFHKMVVRDLATLTEEAVKAGTFAFSIPAVEAATAQFVADFEKQNSFAFPVKLYTIDKTKLAVAIFAQDRTTQAVLNAAVADVK